MRNLVIGDIHACFKTFKKLLEKVELSKNDKLYILGDLINRGKRSKDVIDFIIKKQEEGYKIFPIRGNHEQMVLNLINESRFLIEKYTLYYKSSDLLNSRGKFKKKYIDFFNDLPFYIETDNSIFVHAALDLTRDNIFDNKDFMLYSRHQRGKTKRLNGKKLIHGHVPEPLDEIKNNVNNKSQIIGIDNGCIFGSKRKSYGKLVCIDADNLDIFTQKNVDE